MTSSPEVTVPDDSDLGASALDELLAQLELEPLGRDLFRAFNRPGIGRTRLFGGLIAAQALRAAQLTTPGDRPIHSLHGYFLRPGRTGPPVVLQVTRLREGRSFATRAVTVIQDGETIFNLIASFHRIETGPEQSSPMAAGVEVPPPDFVVPMVPIPVRRPLEILELVPLSRPWQSGDAAFRALVRPRGAAVADPALSACLLTYVSDINTAFSVCRAVGLDPYRSMVASLDHSLWFHRPAPWTDWLLIDLRPMANASARGLVVGTVHRLDGVQVASLTQEALTRELDGAPRRSQEEES
ncbi:acyl-CoA thioesterase [Nocardia fusca]|uniref:acyl-CoA thioesterase n=1 Tax=Nocardia fusca TaxID=941183 RepID=UPI0037BA0AF0